jgi:hypothetical protein
MHRSKLRERVAEGLQFLTAQNSGFFAVFEGAACATVIRAKARREAPWHLGRVEAVGEVVVDPRQDTARAVAFLHPIPQAAQTHCSSQFQKYFSAS